WGAVEGGMGAGLRPQGGRGASGWFVFCVFLPHPARARGGAAVVTPPPPSLAAPIRLSLRTTMRRLIESAQCLANTVNASPISIPSSIARTTSSGPAANETAKPRASARITAICLNPPPSPTCAQNSKRHPNGERQTEEVSTG